MHGRPPPPPDFDPFAPISAKPKDEAERHKRRVTEAASAGGKAHRGAGRREWNTNIGRGHRIVFDKKPPQK